MQLQQRLVDTAQLFGAQVLVIDAAARTPVEGKRKRPDGVEQVMVGNLAIEQGDYGLLRKKETIQGGQAKFRAASIVAKVLHHQLQTGIEIGVACADALFG